PLFQEGIAPAPTGPEPAVRLAPARSPRTGAGTRAVAIPVAPVTDAATPPWGSTAAARMLAEASAVCATATGVRAVAERLVSVSGPNPAACRASALVVSTRCRPRSCTAREPLTTPLDRLAYITEVGLPLWPKPSAWPSSCATEVPKLYWPEPMALG